MKRRNLLPRIEEALLDTPVVLLQGARQTGKTTLARELSASGDHSRRYVTLDEAGVLAAARSNPTAFLEGLGDRATIDEVQFAPMLFPAIKALVDRERTPGRFLLTGSANVLLLPKLAESLAGRMELLSLWTFSQGELEGVSETFVDQLFARDHDGQPAALAAESGTDGDLWMRVIRGGYPEVQKRLAPRRRSAWFGSYVTTIIQRDVREFANIVDPGALHRLLELVAARNGALANFSEFSRSLSIPQSTLTRHFRLLEATFLLLRLRPWSSNLGKRLVKSPKVYLGDTGLASSLLGRTSLDDLGHGPTRGALLENFVVTELAKQVGWSATAAQLFHYRTQSGVEVDVVLEASDGDLAGIEVKAASSIDSSDFDGLRHLRGVVGDKFVRGVLLYGGSEVLQFERDLVAVPVSALWTRSVPSP